MALNKFSARSIGMILALSACMTLASSAVSAAVIQDTNPGYFSEFFELPLTEIESNLNVSHTTANSNQIVVSVSNVQLKKLIGELEPQRDEIGKDAELFRIAFFDLLLDKLHLSGIYDAVVSEYLSADMPSAWWDPMHPFDVEDCSDGGYACISLQYPENTQNPEDHLEEYTLRNGDTNVTVDRYELTQRSLYVILTYGDRAYFSDAYEEPIALSTTTAETTTAETTTAESTTTASESSDTDTATETTITISLSADTDTTTVTTLTTLESVDTNTTTALTADSDLPQTGNNNAKPLMIALGALLLTGTGSIGIVRSGVFRRKREQR